METVLCPVRHTTNSGRPTRWGNHLNGNDRNATYFWRINSTRPTRWGNHLNGNFVTAALVGLVLTPPGPRPTRWGNHLNGNGKSTKPNTPQGYLRPTRWGNHLNSTFVLPSLLFPLARSASEFSHGFRHDCQFNLSNLNSHS